MGEGCLGGGWVGVKSLSSVAHTLSLLLSLLLPPSTPLSCCFQLLVGVARRRQINTVEVVYSRRWGVGGGGGGVGGGRVG